MVEKLYLAPGDAALERLRQREPFATILAYDAIVRSAALEGALRSLSDTGVHIIRLANPLRAPLTLERILIQLAGFQDEMSHGENTDSVLRAVLSQLQGGRDRMVISIEQAETLHPMALLLLDQIARPAEPGGPSPQILFTGTPAFARALGHPLLGRMRSVLGIGTPDIVPAEPEAAMPQPVPVPVSVPVEMPVEMPVPVPDQPNPVFIAGPEPVADAPAPRPLRPNDPRPDHLRAVPAMAQAAGDSLASPRMLTATEAGALRPPSRRPPWLVLLLLALLLIGGGAYAALLMHWLPRPVEAQLLQSLAQAWSWTGSSLAALRAKLLPPATLLY